jgi:NAD(P)-dependent dehydrogenase (short-subunit alcohol dehydrogenase family)
MGFDGKVCLVTGAGPPIGPATADHHRHRQAARSSAAALIEAVSAANGQTLHTVAPAKRRELPGQRRR